MNSSERFGGFVAHLERHLGTLRGAEGPEAEGRNRGYSIAFFERSDPGIISAASNGIRFQDVTSIMPEELVCTLRHDQENVARYLVNVVSSMVIGSGNGIEYDQIIKNDQPLIPQTEIQAILAASSPYFGTEFDLLRDGRGNPELQIITLIPITLAEAEYAEENEPEDLFEEWQGSRTNLLDVRRASAI